MLLALPGTAARTGPLLLGVAIVVSLSPLIGCGGTEPSLIGGSSATLGAQAQTPASATPSDTATAVTAPSATKPDGAPSQAAGLSPHDLRLDDEDGQAASMLELAPTDGRGYPTVRVRVVLRGERVISPVANVQAYCSTPTRCEYLPPRSGDRALKYTVSIGEDSIARLSPTKDMIAVTTRELKLVQPVVVTVTLTVEGQPPVTRQIRYLRSAG
jgi:hypothetical protein